MATQLKNALINGPLPSSRRSVSTRGNEYGVNMKECLVGASSWAHTQVTQIYAHNPRLLMKAWHQLKERGFENEKRNLTELSKDLYAKLQHSLSTLKEQCDGQSAQIRM